MGAGLCRLGDVNGAVWRVLGSLVAMGLIPVVERKRANWGVDFSGPSLAGLSGAESWKLD